VEGFFTRFNMACAALGSTNGDMKKVWLVGRLKGSAIAWVQSLGKKIEGMDFEDLAEALCKHFKGEDLSKLRRLEGCRQGSKSVGDYNKKYAKLAAGAGNVAHEIQVKDLYI
jgi:hypothetical protein